MGRQCVGCGRLRGLKSPMECPCWRSVNAGATIPVRLRKYRSRILAAFTGIAQAGTERERASADAVARSVNRSLEEA